MNNGKITLVGQQDIPKVQRATRPSKYPFDKLSLDQGFEVILGEDRSGQPLDAQKVATSIRVSFLSWARSRGIHDRRIVTRTEENVVSNGKVVKWGKVLVFMKEKAAAE